MPLGASKTANYGAVEEIGGTPFSRTVTITPTVDYNTAVFNIASNLPNTTMKYLVTGVANSDFTSGNISSEFTTDSSGDFQFTLQLNETSNYSASNVEFFADVSSVHDLELAQTSNIVITPAPALFATGGTVTNIDEWAVHEFTADNNFVVSGVGRGTAYLQIVGGGGAGGPGQRTQNLIFGGKRYQRYSGSGGGGGKVVQANINTLNFSTQSYPVVVGLGGAGGGGGSTTTFKGYSAVGGGPGGGYEQDPGTGFATGGGGNSTYSSWTDNTTIWNSSPLPLNPTIYSQLYNAYNNDDQLYAWNGSSYIDSFPAYLSNEAGFRPDNEGASGTLFDGGNAIVISADPTTDDAQKPAFLKYDTVGGGGASCIQDGNPNTGSNINLFNGNSNGHFGGTGGAGAVTWDNKPLAGTTLELAPGGDGGMTKDNNFGTPSVGSEPGAGGQGANAGNDTTATTIGLTNFTGADGANGIVKVAYVYRKREFVT